MFRFLLPIVLFLGFNSSFAQDDFPSKPIKIIVPFVMVQEEVVEGEEGV